MGGQQGTDDWNWSGACARRSNEMLDQRSPFCLARPTADTWNNQNNWLEILIKLIKRELTIDRNMVSFYQ